jgi:curved DNA-binding protein CbpA
MSNNNRFNAYAVLGVHRGSGDGEIHTAFTRLCSTFHPDRGGNPHAFIAVTAAYRDIKNEERRVKLDELMAFTCNPCKRCGNKGCLIVYGKRKSTTICPDCRGSGFTTRSWYEEQRQRKG